MRYLLIFLLSISFTAHSQVNTGQIPVQFAMPGGIQFTPQTVNSDKIEGRTLRGGITLDTCGIDTLKYLNTKASVLEWYLMNDTANSLYNSGYSEYYEAPQPIVITGACFYGYMFNAGDSAMVDISLYSVTNDSFPDTVVTQTSVLVDDTYSTTDISVMRYCGEFSPEVTITEDYHIAISTNTTKDLMILSNSYTNSDGAGEGLSFALYTDSSAMSFVGWYDQFETPYNWDFDWIIEPMVKYELNIDLILDTDTICEGETICSLSTIDTIIYSRMYHANYPWTLLYTYDWGGGNTEVLDSLTACHTYQVLSQSDFTIAVSSSFGTWTAGTCVFSANQDVHADFLPVADFVFQDNLGTNISFAETSSYADSILWDLGNGVTTNDSAFVYLFSSHDTAVVTLYVWNDCGMDSAVEYILPDPASVNEIDFSESVQLFPNPVKNFVSIRVNGVGNCRLDLYDATGRVVYADQFIANTEISLDRLSAGIYTVVLRNQFGKATKRLIIQR